MHTMKLSGFVGLGALAVSLSFSAPPALGGDYNSDLRTESQDAGDFERRHDARRAAKRAAKARPKPDAPPAAEAPQSPPAAPSPPAR
jgi:hypothetical protein